MAAPAWPSDPGRRLPLERVKDAISTVAPTALDPFGVRLTHLLTPDYVEADGALPEVSLVAELDGTPDYFTVFGAEDAIAAALGVDVRIIPRRAVSDTHRDLFEASLIPL